MLWTRTCPENKQIALKQIIHFNRHFPLEVKVHWEPVLVRKNGGGGGGQQVGALRRRCGPVARHPSQAFTITTTGNATRHDSSHLNEVFSRCQRAESRREAYEMQQVRDRAILIVCPS